MEAIVFKGIFSGIVLAFLVGPVFFTIIQTSIERGFVSGVFVAIGVSLSDAFYITLSYLGLSQAFADRESQLYLAYAGGMILFAFGVYYLFIKSKRLASYSGEFLRERNPIRLVAKGFIINGLSPMVLIFWLGTVSVATTEFGYVTTTQATVFFSAIVITVFITDIIKAKLADKLRAIMTQRIIQVLNVALGIIMVLFGGRLILYADQLHL